MSASACDHRKAPNNDFCWCKYPQSIYPNWTNRQQKKSALLKVIENETGNCTIHYLEVKRDGMFVNSGTREVNRATQDTQWHDISGVSHVILVASVNALFSLSLQSSKDVRLRMLFVDHCSGPVLQMIGTHYNVEPFFFSSTIGWTPCRFQSNIVSKESDRAS